MSERKSWIVKLGSKSAQRGIGEILLGDFIEANEENIDKEVLIRFRKGNKQAITNNKSSVKISQFNMIMPFNSMVIPSCIISSFLMLLFYYCLFARVMSLHYLCKSSYIEITFTPYPMNQTSYLSSQIPVLH